MTSDKSLNLLMSVFSIRQPPGKPRRQFRKLTDSRCQCSGCGEYFNSDTAFEMHRIGEFGKDRRCMTVAEMLEAGMVKNADDWWITKQYQEWPAKPAGDARDASVGSG